MINHLQFNLKKIDKQINIYTSGFFFAGCDFNTISLNENTIYHECFLSINEQLKMISYNIFGHPNISNITITMETDQYLTVKTLSKLFGKTLVNVLLSRDRLLKIYSLEQLCNRLLCSRFSLFCLCLFYTYFKICFNGKRKKLLRVSLDDMIHLG